MSTLAVVVESGGYERHVKMYGNRPMFYVLAQRRLTYPRVPRSRGFCTGEDLIWECALYPGRSATPVMRDCVLYYLRNSTEINHHRYHSEAPNSILAIGRTECSSR